MPHADFVHLRVRSAYSLLEGRFGPMRLPRPAGRRRCRRWPSTDRANLFGALEFSVATKEAGVQPIVGCALPVPGIGEGPPERWAQPPPIAVLLAQKRTAMRNL